jgi:hypothetical protein
MVPLGSDPFGPFLYLCDSKKKNMEYLPKDPGILVSSVNMLLRDEEFDTLDSLCYHFNKEPEEIKNYLKEQGFVFDEEQKQFRPEGYK